MSSKPNIPVKSSGDTFSAQELNTIVDFFGNKPDLGELIPGPEGPQGVQGIQGPEGPKGDDGKSAYDTAVENGFVGTEQEWLESLSPVRYMDGDIFEGDGETAETKTTIKDGSITEEKLSEDVIGKLGGGINKFNGHKRNVAFGSRLLGLGPLSDGVDTIQTSRFKYRAIGNISDLNIIWGNGVKSSVAPINAITITASLEYPAGNFHQITFNNNPSFLLGMYKSITSDSLNIEIADGEHFWIRTCVEVEPGEKWIRDGITVAAYSEGAIASDATMSGTIANGFGYAYAASAIIGFSTSRQASVLIVADSIGLLHDSGYTELNYSGGGALVGRSFYNNFPTLRLDRGGDSMNVHYNITNRGRISNLFSLCNYFFCELGVNDVQNNRTEAQMKSSYVSIWDNLLARGVFGYQTTLTPLTNAANTTPHTNNSTRILINDWIRDGAPINKITRTAENIGAIGEHVIRAGDLSHPLLGYFEVADLAESSRNSGLWKDGYSTDGVHPNSFAYNAGIYEAIDVSKYMLW